MLLKKFSDLRVSVDCCSDDVSLNPDVYGDPGLISVVDTNDSTNHESHVYRADIARSRRSDRICYSLFQFCRAWHHVSCCFWSILKSNPDLVILILECACCDDLIIVECDLKMPDNPSAILSITFSADVLSELSCSWIFCLKLYRLVDKSYEYLSIVYSFRFSLQSMVMQTSVAVRGHGHKCSDYCGASSPASESHSIEVFVRLILTLSHCQWFFRGNSSGSVRSSAMQCHCRRRLAAVGNLAWVPRSEFRARTSSTVHGKFMRCLQCCMTAPWGGGDLIFNSHSVQDREIYNFNWSLQQALSVCNRGFRILCVWSWFGSIIWILGSIRFA